MRIAIFGDVHGNAFALEAVLDDIYSYAPDQIANLGDGVFGGANPGLAYAMQQDLHIPSVRGNTDERLAQPLSEVTEKKDYLEWLHSQLPQDAGQKLGQLPTTISLLDGAVVCGHGNLHSAWDALLQTKKQWATDAEVLERCTDYPHAQVIVVGHTHLEHLRQIGTQTFINAGSVSRAKDGNPAAKWLLLERRSGLWQASFKRVQYDVEAAAAWALHYAPKGAKEAHQLRTGYPAQ